MPVFNDEKYLSTSLTSIFQQTLTDLEVICINDGSTDNSLEILEDFKSKFNKITIINQQNLGSGVARNNGMSIAKGEYIAFLDADDIFVDDNALEEIYNIAKEKFEEAWYEAPKIIFWNLNWRMWNLPVRYDEEGTALVSGFSPSIMTSLLWWEEISPLKIMMEVLNSDRYKNIK